ncbi:MAG: hypothetical protein ABI467_09600 [Kofleriaceae bacterium]
MTRKRPAADEPENKDRVIHTRVPESLEAELRERAQALGMSVSNLVRNVLGHAFGLVGDVVADSHAIARAAKGGAAAAPLANAGAAGGVAVATSDVLAWQSIVLGKNAVCARCNEILPKGADAAIGLAESGGGRVIVCSPCLEELRR